jgi:predicted ATPase
MCLAYTAPVFLWRGDQQIAEDLTERLISYAAKYSLTMYQASSLALQGELMLTRGETQHGVENLRAALSTLRTERRNILLPAYSRALAEGLARIGSFAEAMNIIDATVADAMRGPGTFELPDLLRARAAVLLAASPANWPAAEASLKESLDWAQRQSALGWELRSAIVLARLWTDHGRLDEARTLLGDVYGRFREGVGTADLIEAERQLRDLEVRALRS